MNEDIHIKLAVIQIKDKIRRSHQSLLSHELRHKDVLIIDLMNGQYEYRETEINKT